jgi:hypothetical protein
MPPSDPADAAEERLSRHRPASALYEFATFRDKASPLAGEWKVTARYELHNGGPAIRCIRLRRGLGPVLHFSEAEFSRLFEPIRRQAMPTPGLTSKSR